MDQEFTVIPPQEILNGRASVKEFDTYMKSLNQEDVNNMAMVDFSAICRLMIPVMQMTQYSLEYQALQQKAGEKTS